MAKLNPAKGATLWKERYEKAEGNQARLFKRFSDWYDSLYAVVGKVPSPWRSKVYVPVLARQTWSLVSKFLQLSPGFEVRLRDGDIDDDLAKERAEKAQRKLETDYDNPDMDESVRERLFEPLLDAVVTGTGLAKVCWKVETKKFYRRFVDENGYADLTQEEVTTKTVGHNDLEPVNIFNVFVSPAAGSNIYKAPWLIIREDNKPISDLKKINEQGGIEIYENLDQLSGKSPESTNDDYNRSRNRLLNNESNRDETVDTVTLYECYEDGKICTYAEDGSTSSDKGWVLIREQKNIYWHGRYPLVKFHVKKRPFNFWGEGIFEINYRLQAAYNDAFNHYFDQWNLSENSMLMMQENANVNDYIIEPGGTLTYRGDTPPQQFKHAAPDPSGLQVLLTLMDGAIEGNTISQYAAGTPNSASDKTKGTATGILKLQEAAGDLISFFRTNFKQSILQIGKQYLSNNQQFMAEPEKLLINMKSKMQEVDVSPADLQGDMRLTIDDASMQPATKEEQRDTFVAFVSQELALKQAADAQAQLVGTDPLVFDFTEWAQDMAEKFGIKGFDKVIMSQEELQQKMEENAKNVAMHMQEAEQQAAQEQELAAQQQADEQQAAADQEVAQMVDYLASNNQLNLEGE